MMLNSVKQYNRVSSQDDDNSISRDELSHLQHMIRKSRIAHWTQFFIYLGGSICLFAVFAISTVVVGSKGLPLPQDICRIRYNEVTSSCGNSTAEAQALGCSFDLLAAAWLPEECQDRDLTEEFRAQGPWQYFEDSDGQVELREGDLWKRSGPSESYWATRRWHTVHCSFEWRKMHRAIERGARMEDALRDYRHTIHCGKMFLKEGPWDELTTEITVEFLGC